MERLIDKIREKFPAPKIAGEFIDAFTNADSHHYCVLMAFQRFFEGGLSVKRWSTFSEQRGLTLSEVMEIYCANDSRNFELAWELLAQAIEKHNIKE